MSLDEKTMDLINRVNLAKAAPDLLQILQEAVNKGYMWDNDSQLWSRAVAAIAKAKGE
jgi:hypothetical protein